MYYVMPRPGLTPHGLARQVVDPDRRDTLPLGEFRAVPENPYWLRRQAEGDVILTRDPPAPAAPPEPAAEAAPAARGKKE